MAALTINLDEAARGALDRLTESTGSTADWLVSRAVEAYAAHDAWQLQKIKLGIAEGDHGDFASDEDVQRVRAKFA